jgi:hypothetical protein
MGLSDIASTFDRPELRSRYAAGEQVVARAQPVIHRVEAGDRAFGGYS